MFFSPPTLHAPLITSDRQADLVRGKIAALTAGRPKGARRPVAAGASVSIALSTVSLSGNFDAFIDVTFVNSPATATLLVDSGSTSMIIPNGEDLVGVPGYTILGTATEPFGCPANVVQGTVQIEATDGGTYGIDNCVFFACTGENSKGQRTANFGMGSISPWHIQPIKGLYLQSPLSYGIYPYAEVIFAPAVGTLSTTADIVVNQQSLLVLHTTPPSGYTLLDIITGLQWMSVVPTSLAIGGTTTAWPGNVSPLIAMIDTGGGPVLLSDPNGYVWPKPWPYPVSCPSWFSTSQNCNCITDPLQIGLVAAGGGQPYGYTIDPNALPTLHPVLTAVMCKMNVFMEGQQGMNVGGITALFNRILIDYAGTQVGLAPKAP